MSGSKVLASCVALSMSGVGNGVGVENKDRIIDQANMATMIDVPIEVHDLKIALNFSDIHNIAPSYGSVLCCTSARIANRMSGAVLAGFRTSHETHTIACLLRSS